MIFSDRFQQFFRFLTWAGLFLLVLIIFFQQINFNSLDLGRHLANGREIWTSPALLFENFYSYTEPEYRFVNHHWLAGVIYYVLYLLGGFKILSIFNILLAWGTVYLGFRLAEKRAGLYWTAFVAVPAIIVLSQRTDIRPESFSYLFILLTWYFLEKAAETGFKKYLYWLLPLFLVWVNIHIYFFIGLLIVAFYAAAVFLPPAWKKLFSGADLPEVLRAGWEDGKLWIKFLGFSILVSLINPNTWRGLLYPFNILREYGYEIAENKSVFFLEDLLINPTFYIYKWLLVFLFVSLVAYWLVRKKIPLFETFLALFLVAFSLFASRNLAIFSLVAWIIASRNFSVLSYLGSRIPMLVRPEVRRSSRYVGAGLFFLIISFSAIYLLIDARGQNKVIKQSPGLDLSAGSRDAAKFYNQSGLTGPIFNNYDLGSALVFWHFPQEKVFVDNRPEAYSVGFFRDTYKPMQESRFSWDEKSRAYGIKTVYFSHTDMTPWARQFVNMIMHHPDWTLLYFDRYIVILALTKETDQAIIDNNIIAPGALRNRIREQAMVADRSGKFNLAALAELAGVPDIASEVYRQVLLDNPNDSQALVSLAYIYAGSVNQGDWRQALSYFDRALEAGQILPDVYNQRGLVHWNLGDYKKAAADWQTALSYDRDNASARHYLAELDRLIKEKVITID